MKLSNKIFRSTVHIYRLLLPAARFKLRAYRGAAVDAVYATQTSPKKLIYKPLLVKLPATRESVCHQAMRGRIDSLLPFMNCLVHAREDLGKKCGQDLDFHRTYPKLADTSSKHARYIGGCMEEKAGEPGEE
ncbi:hypothetical protein KC331_g68 [Hortaea werneckii]|nr:hypothetical protein KC331_g68 [Hortaea werneckii]